MHNGTRKMMACFVSLLPLLLAAPRAWGGLLHGSAGGEDGAHVDLVMRKVTVTPIRAHVGDVIRIDMEWEYWGELVNNYYDTTDAEVLANGKVVAKKPFTYGYGASLGEVWRETLLWNTKGMSPGTYRIRGAIPLRLDATPYNNFLDEKKPLLLLPEGAAFPSGEEEGGTAVAENPY